MAADTCKGITNTALFAGTVFKGIGTRPRRPRAVKIQYFAQSAGNFSTLTGGSSETTRADPLSTFNAQLGERVDRNGYFTIRSSGTLAFQLTAHTDDPILVDLQTHFGAKTAPVPGGLRWRTTRRETVRAIVERVNGHVRVERRFRQFTAVCRELGITPRRPTG